ncbi:MAG: hypothetical protein S4CHLAM81_05430 [Chlamydiales bacterium]|nr:hypothetical protein [Chlamydiales bacterium]MCH9635329.1 hypothetical protein [Chlamydiales bacterium]MCH9703501.1 hypothetical protein [Chlamydiota bacterium]
MRFLLLLLFASPLFGENFTYLIQSQEGELLFDKTTKVGTLTMERPSQLVPLFSIGEQRNMGYTHLNDFVHAWKGPAYAMVSYYGLDAEKNVYHAIPLKLEKVTSNGDLVFEIKVLNDLQVEPKTKMGETLLYVDNLDGADPGCLFPGAGWSTSGCHQPKKAAKK